MSPSLTPHSLNISNSFSIGLGLNKLSRLLQPSVIVIEDVDRLFMKKSVRMERWDMRRMRKELPKILRAIGPEDRVLLVGTSSTPWECDQRVNLMRFKSIFAFRHFIFFFKNLSQVFQRMIGIPPPDYGTRFTLWDHFIRQATRSSQYTTTPAELTNLARISDSYTPGSIARSVSEVTYFPFLFLLFVYLKKTYEIVW